MFLVLHFLNTAPYLCYYFITGISPVYLQGCADMQVYETDDKLSSQVHWDAVWYLYILNLTWRHTHTHILITITMFQKYAL